MHSMLQRVEHVARVLHNHDLPPVIDGGYYGFNSSGFPTFPMVPKSWKSQ